MKESAQIHPACKDPCISNFGSNHQKGTDGIMFTLLAERITPRDLMPNALVQKFLKEMFTKRDKKAHKSCNVPCNSQDVGGAVNQAIRGRVSDERAIKN